MQIENISVIGAGAWGTAIACYLARKGLAVRLWAHEKEVVRDINENHINSVFLPDIPLPEEIFCDNNLEEVVPGAEILVMVVPSHFMRNVLKEVSGHLSPGVSLVSAAKGIENETLLTMTQLFEEVLPTDLAVTRAVLSGPSFAREVGLGLPTAVTLAATGPEAARRLQQALASPAMRVYSSQDLIGVELGGALKNVVAIVAGIADGMNLGLNARAAIITRGLAEITRLGVKMGANPLTFAGLAGMGDLVLTATGDLSRNRTVGLKLGQGMSIEEILEDMKQVAEGVKTTKSTHGLSIREKIDMPITRKLYQVLYEGKKTKEAMVELLARDLKDEIG